MHNIDLLMYTFTYQSFVASILSPRFAHANLSGFLHTSYFSHDFGLGSKYLEELPLERLREMLPSEIYGHNHNHAVTCEHRYSPFALDNQSLMALVKRFANDAHGGSTAQVQLQRGTVTTRVPTQLSLDIDADAWKDTN